MEPRIIIYPGNKFSQTAFNAHSAQQLFLRYEINDFLPLETDNIINHIDIY